MRLPWVYHGTARRLPEDYYGPVVKACMALHQEKSVSMQGVSSTLDVLGVLDADFSSGVHLNIQISTQGSCMYR